VAELFSAEWMAGFREAWNAEPALAGELAKIGFNSTIGYGFKGEPTPRGVLVIENGTATHGGAFDGEEVNWDLRADQGTWEGWIRKPPGMMGLGMAYTSKKLQFAIGDYAAMIKDPRMAGPFMKSFAVMADVS